MRGPFLILEAAVERGRGVGRGLRWLAGRGLAGSGAAGGWALGGLVALALGAVWQLGFGGIGPLSWGGVLWLVGGVWALAVAGAAGLPAAGFAGACVWLAWHGIALMAPWTGTAMVAWPVLWLWGVGRWRFPRGSGLFRLGLALGAGWLVAEPSGWNRLLGLAPEQGWLGRLALGGLWAGLGGWGGGRAAGSFGGLALVGLLVMGLGLAASAWRDAAAAAGWAWGVVESCGGWAAQAWFWLGGGFALVLLQGAEGLTRRLMARRARGRVWWLACWLVVTLLEWLATHGGLSVLGPWAEGVPLALQLAGEAHAWVGLVVLVFGVGFWWQGRDLARLLPRLNALWLAALVGLWAVGEALPGALEGGGGPARGAAGVLVVGGWWMLRRLRGEAPVESGLLWPFRLSGLAAVMGMVLAESLLPGAAWGDRGGEAALLGMLHLGLPLAMHGWWTRGRAEGKGPSLMGLLWLSLGGMVSVLPLLQRHAGDAALLAFCPLVWLGGLLGLRAWQPRWDAAGGALAGAVMGVAAVAAWCRPGLLLPEVPLISWLNVPAGALSEPLARPFLNPAHFILLLLLGSAGALLGALVFRARGGAEGLGVPLLAVDARVLAPGP